MTCKCVCILTHNTNFEREQTHQSQVVYIHVYTHIHTHTVIKRRNDPRTQLTYTYIYMHTYTHNTQFKENKDYQSSEGSNSDLRSDRDATHWHRMQVLRGIRTALKDLPLPFFEEYTMNRRQETTTHDTGVNESGNNNNTSGAEGAENARKKRAGGGGGAYSRASDDDHVIKSPLMRLKYYDDGCRVVKNGARDNKKERGASDPEAGVVLDVVHGSLCYGPWENRQRESLQGFFFPPDFEPKQAYAPKEGQLESKSGFRLNIFFKGSVRMHMPYAKTAGRKRDFNSSYAAGKNADGWLSILAGESQPGDNIMFAHTAADESFMAGNQEYSSDEVAGDSSLAGTGSRLTRKNVRDSLGNNRAAAKRQDGKNNKKPSSKSKIKRGERHADAQARTHSNADNHRRTQNQNDRGEQYMNGSNHASHQNSSVGGGSAHSHDRQNLHRDTRNGEENSVPNADKGTQSNHNHRNPGVSYDEDQGGTSGEYGYHTNHENSGTSWNMAREYSEDARYSRAGAYRGEAGDRRVDDVLIESDHESVSHASDDEDSDMDDHSSVNSSNDSWYSDTDSDQFSHGSIDIAASEEIAKLARDGIESLTTVGVVRSFTPWVFSESGYDMETEADLLECCVSSSVQTEGKSAGVLWKCATIKVCMLPCAHMWK